MAKQLCIIHANCQGDSLKQLLTNTPVFDNLFTIEKYTNYLHDKIPQSSLESCALFLYQQLGSSWGDIATSSLLQKLPPKTHCLCIPNMFFNGYWPLWTNATHMAYGDLLLEHLANSGLGIGEILHIYMHGNIKAKYNIDELVATSREKEIIKEREITINTLSLIDEFWKEEQLFHTVNHPAARLSLYVADSVLQYLGLGNVPLGVRKAFTELDEEFTQPIHPQIAKHFGLKFATNDCLYNVYGQKLNFEQYTRAYVNCRMQQGADKIDDFVVYLHLLAKKANNLCAA